MLSSSGFAIAGPQALELASEAATRDLQQLEHDLVESGSLTGIDREFILREGVVWEELQSIVSQNQIELLVLGTHGRDGIGIMLFGSVAENAFRHADCLVLTVGPNSYPSPFSTTSPKFLFATDFGEGSLRALPHAISFANHMRAKLTFLHVVPVPSIPEHPSRDILLIRDAARMAYLRRLAHLITDEQELALRPAYLVEFGPPSEKNCAGSLETQGRPHLHGIAPFCPVPHSSANTACEVVCNARCPVLTVRTQ